MRDSGEGNVMPATFSLGQALSWGGSVPLQPSLPLMEEVVVAPGSLPSLAKALEAVPEHRHPRGFRADQPPVPLIPTLLLLLIGMLCGRLGYLSMAEWGRQCSREQPEVLDALGFPKGRKPRSPVAATLFRMVRDMELAQFQEALEDWLGAMASALHLKLPEREKVAVPADQIALDGKRVRGASERRGGGDPEKTGLHLVAAYVPALRTVLDQLATEGKGRELAAAEMLLGRLPLKDRVITGDALLTQREVCKQVLEGGGDYLLPVKENQPALLGDIQEAFSPSAAARPGGPKAARAHGAGEAAADDAAGCPSGSGAGAGYQGQARSVRDPHPVGPSLDGPEQLPGIGWDGGQAVARGEAGVPHSAGGGGQRQEERRLGDHSRG